MVLLMIWCWCILTRVFALVYLVFASKLVWVAAGLGILTF